MFTLPRRSDAALKPKRNQFTFKKSRSTYSKLVDPEISINNESRLTPGPGEYDPSSNYASLGGPKFTMSKQKAGYSYLPNSKTVPLTSSE